MSAVKMKPWDGWVTLDLDRKLHIIMRSIPLYVYAQWEPDIVWLANRTTINNKDECWLWSGPKNRKGYAHAELFGRPGAVHRSLFIAIHGSIPTTTFVCHKCDVRNCLNPLHFFPGTTRDNILDAKQKGRLAVGVNNKRSKLTPEDVLEIRRRSAAGETSRSIASSFGVFHSCILSIRTGRTWSHLK